MGSRIQIPSQLGVHTQPSFVIYFQPNKKIRVTKYKNKGVCHTLALPFTLRSILRQKKKNYGNSNNFTIQKCNLQKNPLKETKILQDIMTL
jgi:hypothetical protein